MRRPVASLALLTAILPWLPRTSAAEEALQFTRARLLRAASIERVLIEDLTGDGRPDILVQQSPGRNLALFAQKPDGAFPFKADQTVTLREDVFAWCLGVVDASRKPRICAFTPEGVIAYPMADGKLQEPREILVHPTLFTGTSKRPPVYCNLLMDVDGDGDSDCVLPQRDSFYIFTQTAPGRFMLNQHLPFNLTVTRSQWGSGLGRLVSAYAIPSFQAVDLLGLGRPQLVFFRTGDLATVYRQDAGGRFSPVPAAEFLMATKKSGRARLIRYELPPTIVDVNNDGAVDFVKAVPRRGELFVYLGARGRANFPTLQHPREPDARIDIDGYIPNYWLVDLNGDGLQDLILATVDRVNVFSGLQMLLTRQVDEKLMVFLGKPGQGYGPQPDYAQPFTVTLTLYATREAGDIDMPFFPNFDGDFNRDGLKDLVIKRSPTSLAIYPGTREGVFAAEPMAELPIDSIYDKTTIRVADLNGDGKSDLVLHHIDWDTMFHDVELYLSK